MPADALALLRALSDPNRHRVYTALRHKERCVSDLVAEVELSQPLVSHHLRVLGAAGLVTSRRVDGYTMYALDPAGLAAARGVMAELLDPDALAPTARPGGNPACCQPTGTGTRAVGAPRRRPAAV